MLPRGTLGSRTKMKEKVPEFFCTNVRKIEPVGGDCIRIYCSIERNGAWEDKFTILMPIGSAVGGSRFVIESATEIFNASQMALERERVH